MASENAKIGVKTLFDILPDTVQAKIFSLIEPTRARNSASLVCRQWRILERQTRSSLSLRVTPIFPNTVAIHFPHFPYLSALDLSNLSPWGRVSFQNPLLNSPILPSSLPSVTSLTLYAHDPIAQFLSHWPNLKRVKLVRFHIPPSEPNIISESYLRPLFQNCREIEEIDLSGFSCRSEDVTDAIVNSKPVAKNLTSLNLMLGNASDGFRASELISITEVCQNLRQLIAPCVFNPRYTNFASDNNTLVKIAANCPNLTTLHLVDNVPVYNYPNAYFVPENNPSVIVAADLETLFSSLPLLTNFSLDLCQPIHEASPALETLGHPRINFIKNLKLGNFQDVCKGRDSCLDGIALCSGLEVLCLKNCGDVSNDSLKAIADGCTRLSKFELIGCSSVTELGIQKLALGRRETLIDFSLSVCELITTPALVKALKALRGQLQRLHINCQWTEPESKKKMHDLLDKDNKSCKSERWNNLRELSLQLPVGETLSPQLQIYFDECPNLSSVTIKVAGYLGAKPKERAFGLNLLSIFQNLAKLKLDLDMAMGHAVNSPFGEPMDRSLWEQFYLFGIRKLSTLQELEYWPPQGVVTTQQVQNHRILSSGGAELIVGCNRMRKLVIHGTTDQNSMMSFTNMMNLRDAQLREDYPTLEDDGSTEMRYALCRMLELRLKERRLLD